MNEQRGVLRRVLSAFWNAITRVRVALSNLLFLGILLLVFVAFSNNAPEPLPARAALLLNPVGSIVEQRSAVDPLLLLMGEQAPEEREVLLRDVLDAIRFARDDDRITALVMDLDMLFGVGVSKAGDIAEALDDFRGSGKPIIAAGSSYSQGQYLLAAQADKIIMHPLGGIGLEGFSNYQWYFRDALEKLDVSMHVFRAGDHKSIAEPYLRNDMSASEREISQRWLDGLWSEYTRSIETQRGLEEGGVDRYVESLVKRLEQSDGDLAQVALDSGLVDELLDRWQTNNLLVGQVGATDEDGYFQAIQFESYVRRQRMGDMSALSAGGGRNEIAVVTARGMILDGEQPAGTIGGDTLARQLRDAAESPEVAAIVLRIDSGGGSVFASEVIRQQVLYARSLGKTVVASMGSVAASGGYWIAAPANEIWAQPTTLTGSIGVFAAFPTLEKLFERFGVSTDGVGTTPVAGSLRIDRPLDPVMARAVQISVDNIYDRFINLVAEGRDMAPEKVEAVAGGRVWTGEDALELGLVDALGGLQDAIEAAASLADLEDYRVEYVAPEMSPREEFVRQLTEQAHSWLMPDGSRLASGLLRWSVPLRQSFDFAVRMNDPRDLYAHCTLCLSL